MQWLDRRTFKLFDANLCLLPLSSLFDANNSVARYGTPYFFQGNNPKSGTHFLTLCCPPRGPAGSTICICGWGCSLLVAPHVTMFSMLCQVWRLLVVLNLLLRHGVSGGSDRGPGESAAGPRRRPGGHHHLLMMERISNRRQHPDIMYSEYFTHNFQSRVWNVDFWIQKKFILFL